MVVIAPVFFWGDGGDASWNMGNALFCEKKRPYKVNGGSWYDV